MKRKVLKYLIICILLSCNLSAQLTKIPVDLIPKAVLVNAKILAFDFYNSSKPRDFTKFIINHGNMSLLKNYNLSDQDDLAKQIKKEYGNLLKVTLHETLKGKDGSFILRYKGFYDNVDDISEIRVTTNSLFKFSSIIFFPWYYKQLVEVWQKVPFENVEIKNIDSSYVQRATDFADRTFRCNSANFLKLTTENSTKRLRNWYSIEKLNWLCEKRYEYYGSLIYLDLNDIVTDGYRIMYRYKAEYERVEEVLEIVVFTDPNHKLITTQLIGIWREKYKDVNFEKSN